MKLVHITELRARFGIPHHPQHIRKLIKAGKFPQPIRCGKLTTFDESKIDAHLEGLKANVTEAPPENRNAGVGINAKSWRQLSRGHEVDFQVLMDELKAVIGKSPVQAENGRNDLDDVPACLDKRRRP